ncbi:unnamed protein product [Candidula unifasciata]|uniref:WASH complex subunit 3 n=1 Tax=Candidula unifasciata TaxID=100452 RepID=A0A8S3YSQ2_9EUPU|nr:unnamed protein product [Candidula unifasciata]
MDADGLPLVGPGIDYNKVDAINQKRTIAFLNHFVTHTSRFLNHFANVCEDKLEKLTERLQQLEISLSILEAKLSSIPGLESVTAPSTSSSVVTSDVAATSNLPSSASAAPPQTLAPVAASPAQVQPENLPPVEEPKPSNPVSQDPRYAKYFKMLQYGVPPPVVKGKMAMDGLSPDMLE